MKSVLNYLLEDCGCVLVDAESPDYAVEGSKQVLTKDGDYVTLDILASEDGIAKNIIYRHKLTDIQALDKGSGCAVQLGFNQKEQKWYGWTHRGWGAFGIGQKLKKGTVVFDSKKYPVKDGFEIKTLEDAKYCAKAIADALD